MANKEIVSDEMFASVIDGVATQKERYLFYNTLEEDNELKQTFMDCMYLKVFEEEIESDFQKRYEDQKFGLKQPVEVPENSCTFQGMQLSVNYLENVLKNMES